MPFLYLWHSFFHTPNQNFCDHLDCALLQALNALSISFCCNLLVRFNFIYFNISYSKCIVNYIVGKGMLLKTSITLSTGDFGILSTLGVVVQFTKRINRNILRIFFIFYLQYLVKFYFNLIRI